MYQRAICRGSIPPSGVADLERDEDTHERQPVLDEVRRRGEDPDRAEHGVARASERVGAGDVGDGKQADEDPAGVAHPRARARRLRMPDHPRSGAKPNGLRPARSTACPVAARIRPTMMDITFSAPKSTSATQKTTATGRTGATAHGNDGEPAARLRSSEARAPTSPAANRCRRRRRGCRSRFQRAGEDGEERHCERGEDARSHQTSLPAGARGEYERGRGRRSALKPASAALPWSLAQDPEQRRRGEEGNDRADVDESTFSLDQRGRTASAGSAVARSPRHDCDERTGRREASSTSRGRSEPSRAA